MPSVESLTELPAYPLDTRTYSEPYVPTPVPPIQTDPPPYGAPVTDSLPKDGETPPYRHPHFIGKDLITTFHSDPTVNTTFRCLVRAKDKWPDRLSMGTRKVLGVYNEDRKGKNWTMWELGDYEYMTFKELWEEVLVLGSSLIELGLARCDKVGIYMQTWLEFPINFLFPLLTGAKVRNGFKPRSRPIHNPLQLSLHMTPWGPMPLLTHLTLLVPTCS